jgi:hypothetical protein
MLDKDTLRLINNQRREYAPHPFKRPGLEDFSILFSRFKKITDQELVQYLDLIDGMRGGHIECDSCTGKILAFCELFTADRLPERHEAYRAEYERITKDSRNEDRDYRAEIKEVVSAISPD